jgi:hypothetical protein
MEPVSDPRSRISPLNISGKKNATQYEASTTTNILHYAVSASGTPFISPVLITSDNDTESYTKISKVSADQVHIINSLNSSFQTEPYGLPF